MDRPFPPGPKGPEDPEPGPTVTLSRKQAAAVAKIAATCSAVQVEDRGAAYKEVTRYGIEGEELDRRTVFPDGGLGTETE